MKMAHLLRENWTLVLVTLGVLILTVPALAAANQTLHWPAELVALDEAGRTITVKTMYIGEQPHTELGSFKAGDRIAFTWSGVTDATDAVHRIARYDVASKSEDRFMGPVEFVSFDAATRHVTFKAQVPGDGFAEIKGLKAGEWVRIDSTADGIVKVVPYLGSLSARAPGQTTE